ncbi:MAG TPA: ankyrin repeat domain-containing protein [Terriglobia bacterium]|nr:ankyrin repeat domain-containing protein [Terriglobia bacterium]
MMLKRSGHFFPLLLAFLLTAAVISPSVGLAAGAEPAALSDAARAGNWATVRSLIADGLKGDGVNSSDNDGTRPLHWAVRADELEIADLLLKAGADATAQNRLGLTALNLAATNGNGAMIRKLLDHGANANEVEKTGETVLMAATRSGSSDAVRAILERGVNPNTTESQLQSTALMMAAEAGYTESVRALLEYKADINARSRTGAAPARKMPCAGQTGCGSHGDGIVRGGLPDQGYRPPIPGNMNALMFAAREGHVDAARLLLDAGSDVNAVDKNDITPLFMSISNNRIPMARFLIDRGANFSAKDWYGRTPLIAAIEMRDVDLDYQTFEHIVNAEDRKVILDFIGYLLDKGVDTNIRLKEVPPLRSWMYLLGGSLAWVDFTGETPFMLASLSGDVSTMRLLLKHGADPKIATFGGTTPLMAAAGVNWVVDQTYDEGPDALLEAVKLCYELGMDVNATNTMGLTAVMGAANRGSDPIIEFLVSKGARLDVKDNVGRTAFNWSEGIFLATHAPVPKPTSMALIQKLAGQAK